MKDLGSSTEIGDFSWMVVDSHSERDKGGSTFAVSVGCAYGWSVETEW